MVFMDQDPSKKSDFFEEAPFTIIQLHIHDLYGPQASVLDILRSDSPEARAQLGGLLDNLRHPTDLARPSSNRADFAGYLSYRLLADSEPTDQISQNMVSQVAHEANQRMEGLKTEDAELRDYLREVYEHEETLTEQGRFDSLIAALDSVIQRGVDHGRQSYGDSALFCQQVWATSIETAYRAQGA